MLPNCNILGYNTITVQLISSDKLEGGRKFHSLVIVRNFKKSSLIKNNKN